MQTQRGFTLVEILIAVGIIALVAVGAVTVSASARSMAVSSAANRFDSLLDAARTMARESSNGVTIAFTPDAYGDGFVARLYHNRPGTEPLAASNAPALEARVSITETETLGTPGFALVIHATGAVAGIAGNVLAGTAGPETPCPASGRYRFVLAYAGARVERSVSCHLDLATTGPVAYASITPATPQPSPTMMSCLQPTCSAVPVLPRVSVTCPPRYIEVSTAACANPPLTVFPRSLTFINSGNPAALTYTVHEDSYFGAFNIADDCGGSIKDIFDSTNGPTAIHTVSALQAWTCTITVTDERGSPSQSVSVGIGNTALGPLFVCDKHSPPAPVNTDLGPDADGVHEDISSGVSCQPSTPTPAPIPSPTAVPSSFSVIAVIETEIVADCDAGSAGSSFDVTFPSPDATMGEAATWMANGPKRFTQPDVRGYDPAIPITATLIERHVAPAAQECVH